MEAINSRGKRAVNRLKIGINKVLNGDGLRSGSRFDRYHRMFKVFITVVILINIAAIFLSSFSDFKLYLYYIGISTLLSLIIFSIEFLMRLFCAPITFAAKTAWRSRLRYLVSLFGMIDLISISPFLISILMRIFGDLDVAGNDFQMINIIKVTLFIKLMRYSRSFHFMIDVLKSVKMELWIGVSISLIVIMISGTLMYYIENEAQPEAFHSVGQGLWWSIITFATVGYGDIYPITSTGKVIASLIAFIGIGTIAIPAGIISSAFFRKMSEVKQGMGKKSTEPLVSQLQRNAEVLQDEQKSHLSDQQPSKKCYCPYCGHKLEE